LWLNLKKHLLGDFPTTGFSFLRFKSFFSLAQAQNGGTIDRVVEFSGAEWSLRESIGGLSTQV
jgi:hypothetical protein